MTNTVKASCFIALFRLVTVTPIWYYLLYQILIRVEATGLMIFLFWIYVPLHIFLAVSSEIVVRIMMKSNQNEKSD